MRLAGNSIRTGTRNEYPFPPKTAPIFHNSPETVWGIQIVGKEPEFPTFSINWEKGEID
jgi:hypothetical protein